MTGPRSFSGSLPSLDETSRKLNFQKAVRQQRPAKLIDRVRDACSRLAGAGWAELLKHHGLDIEAADLARELDRPLPAIDRTQPGFVDFALDGFRGIEPGSPSRSLLYHAWSSPEVRSYRSGEELKLLTEFPTLAEIEDIENYVFGRWPPSIDDLRARAGDAHLAIVVFACEYRPGVDTVHRKHADLCFSRTGIARIGTRQHAFVARERGYSPLVPGDGTATAALPCRYAAYIAALVFGEKGRHGPMGFIEPKTSAPSTPPANAAKDAGLAATPTALQKTEPGDVTRRFWVPLHKLFDGAECIRDHDLEVRLAATHVNEKIRRAHLFFGALGHDGGWQEPDLSEPPFVLRDGIAMFSDVPADGSWLLTPVPHQSLVEPAVYRNKPLTYKVPESVAGKTSWTAYQSSLSLSSRPSGARAAPEYLHARHAIDESGETNLNQKENVRSLVLAGKYWARHYVDYTGDGWISVECSALALDIPRRLPAYSIVASPDYFPIVRQSDLTQWTDQSAPPRLLSTIWPENPGRPEPLSAQRFAANLELHDAGFDRFDDTMTAIVGALGSGAGSQCRLERPLSLRSSMLPDGAAGVFAPGWDVSYDRLPEVSSASGVEPGVTFLTNYGLGSPFVEDTMLCAALSSFWPAVAPDVTRAFAPGRRYATATPLTDAVIGLEGSRSWDGIEAPAHDPATRTVTYRALAYGDYVEAALTNRFDVSVIAGTTVEDYIARTLTMALVYEALGATTAADKARWSVLSFRLADPSDPELIATSRVSGRRFNPRLTYRYLMIRHDGKQSNHPDKIDKIVVAYSEIVLFFADPTVAVRFDANENRVQTHVAIG